MASEKQIRDELRQLGEMARKFNEMKDKQEGPPPQRKAPKK
jgi:hypothetical protein